MKGTTRLSRTRKYGNRTYHLERSYRMKTDANKKAKNIRDKGMTARIEKIGHLWRVYEGPKAKG